MKRRVVVTGASGHLGYHVGKAALAEGLAVDLLVRRVNINVDALAAQGACPHVVDFAHPETYGNILRGADALFHVAATNTMDTRYAGAVLAGTHGLAEQVLNAAIDAAAPVIVHTSSVVVLGRSSDPRRLITEQGRNAQPESPYVQGKMRAEELCERLIRDRGADIRRVYPSWLIGLHDPRGTPPQQAIGDYLRRGQPFYFEGGISIASIEEVALGHIAAWTRGEPRGTYILGGENVTFRQFFADLADLTGRKPPRVFVPKGLLVMGATVLQAAAKAIGVTPPIDPAYLRSGISAFSWYDSTKARDQLGYRTRPLRKVLAEGVLMERRRVAGTHRLVERVDQRAASLPPLLLTGAPGWLGNRFIEILLNAAPSRVVHLLVEPGKEHLLDLPSRFKIFPVDLTQPTDLSAALEGIHTVVHLAGAIFPNQTAALYRVNTEGTKNLAAACIARGIRRVLYASTDSVCGHGTPAQRIFDEHTPDRPYGPYGRSKWLAEQYLHEQSERGLLDVTILRGFWFFGPFAPPRQQQFLSMLRRRRQLVFGNGKNYRSITHLDNMVAAFLAAESATSTFGKTYWIGDARSDYTVDDIYRTLCEGVGSTYRPVYIPRLVCAAMRMLDALLNRVGRLDATVYGVSKFDFDIAGAIDAARRDFQFEPPVSLEEYARRISAEAN